MCEKPSNYLVLESLFSNGLKLFIVLLSTSPYPTLQPVRLRNCSGGGGAPWDRATKNVKKPPNEKGRTFRKLKRYILTPSNMFDFVSALPFFPGIRIAKKLGSLTHKLITSHIYENHINLRFLYIFGGSGLLCGAAYYCTLPRSGLQGERGGCKQFSYKVLF